MSISERPCTACGRVLPVSSFAYKHRGNGAQLTSYASRCRECDGALRRESEKAFRESLKPSGPALDPAPLAEEISAYIDRNRFGFTPNELANLGKMSPLEYLCVEAGVSDRTLRRIITGEQKRVSADVADRLCMAMGLMLAMVYPEDREQVAA